MANDVWNNVLEILKIDPTISQTIFDGFLKKIELVRISDKLIVLSCSDEYAMGIIKGDVISKAIRNAISTVLDSEYNVSYIIKGNEEFADSIEIAENKLSNKNIENTSSPNTSLNAAFTFENFIVGNCNRFAHAAAINVSEKPGISTFNPLFIWGNSGLGKTHLMQAIGNRIVERLPGKKVKYVTCENFVNQYIECAPRNSNNNFNKAYESFRNLYRNVDVLLIDDIQFLIGKEGSQTEFFNTFESLINAGKQIVITSDKAPSNLTSLDIRLTSRFENGYQMDVQPPDFETRKAILLMKLAKDPTKISDEAINYVCSEVTRDIRQLNGAYNALSAYYAVSKTEIDMNNVSDVIRNFISPKTSQQITTDMIISTVSNYYGISVELLKSKNRSRNVLNPRYVTMYLLRNLIENITIEEVGQLFNRDHSTVINAIDNVSKNDSLLKDAKEVEKLLKNENTY